MAEHTEQQTTPTAEQTTGKANHPVELDSDQVVERTEAPVNHVYSTPVPVVTASKKDPADAKTSPEETPRSEFSYLFNDEEGDPYDILIEQRKHGETYSGNRLGNALPRKPEEPSPSVPQTEEQTDLSTAGTRYFDVEEDEEDKERFSLRTWWSKMCRRKEDEEEEEPLETVLSEPELPETLPEPSQPEEPAGEEGTPEDLVDLGALTQPEPASAEPIPEEVPTEESPGLPAEEPAEAPNEEPSVEEEPQPELPAPTEPMEVTEPTAEEPAPAREISAQPEPLTPADVYFPPVGDASTMELERALEREESPAPAEELTGTEAPSDEEKSPEKPPVQEPPVPERSPLRVDGVYIYNDETHETCLVYGLEQLPALPVAVEGSMDQLIAREYQETRREASEHAPRMVELTDTLPSLDLPPEAIEAPQPPEDSPKKSSAKFGEKLRQGAALLFAGAGKIVAESKKEEGESEPEEGEFQDYEPSGDPDQIRKDMATLGKQLRLRLYLLGALLGITLLLVLTDLLPFALPAFLKAGESTMPYVLLNTVCLILAMLCSVNTLKNGWSGILNLRGESDGAISFASAICVFYMVYLMLNGRAIADGAFVPVSAVILGFFLNTYGKYLIMKRARNNFRFVTSPEEKYVLKPAEKELGQALVTQVQKEDFRIAYRQKTAFLRQFLHLSYAFDEGEQTSQKWMLPGILFTAVATVLNLILSGSIVQGMMTLCLAACISVPLTNILSVNFPLSRLSEYLLRHGAMLSGNLSAEQFSETNTVLLRDTDLFPNHSVVFCMLRAFGYDRMDEAILDAAALVAEANGPMKDMFENILQDKANDLPKVETVQYEEGEGLIGWVHGSRVLVGNEKLLERYGISAPSKDYTSKYTDGDKSITYLVVSGELVAMFVTEYTANHTVTEQLHKLTKAGIRLLVQTRDCNITKELISKRFGISTDKMELLPVDQMATWDKLQQETEQEEATLAVTGKLTSTVQAILACRKLKHTVSLAVLLQNVGLLLGMLLVLFLAVTSGVTVMSTLHLLIFEAFWLVAVLGVPYLRRFFSK